MEEMKQKSVRQVIKDSPYKLRYILAQCDMSEATYYRRASQGNFTKTEREKLARILNVPIETINFEGE